MNISLPPRVKKKANIVYFHLSINSTRSSCSTFNINPKMCAHTQALQMSVFTVQKEGNFSLLATLLNNLVLRSITQ